MFHTLEIGPFDLHVRALRDVLQVVDDGEGREVRFPVSGVLWAAGEVLARLMVECEIDGLRFLEVGCGLGLASLLLNKRGADITATDQYAHVGRFLAYNAALNEDRPIPYVRSAWDDDDCPLGQFDRLLASDVLYERDQPGLLARFVERRAAPRCEMVVVDPGRGQISRFRRRMAALGFSCRPRSVPEGFAVYVFRR